MTEAYIGEVHLFPYDRIPKGWLPANGRLLPLSQYHALFALLGTTYGGDGRTNFALPDLRGRVPLGWGRASDGLAYAMGQSGGAEAVTLTVGEMPRHNHSFGVSSSTGTIGNASDAHMAAVGFDDLTPTNKRYLYKDSGSPETALHPASLGAAGGGAAHDNMQPFAVAQYCICVVGVFPPRGD